MTKPERPKLTPVQAEHVASPPVPAPVALGGEALNALMPMFLQVDGQGQLLRVGSTIPRMLGKTAEELLGTSLFDYFDFRRPREATTVPELREADGGRLKLLTRGDDKVPLKGLVVPLPETDGALINLSLGISVIDAVRRFSLTAGDFAHTDLTIELLFLFEANTAAMAEGRRLNHRLRNAHAAAEARALTDALTGLKNRRAFERVLNRLLTDGEAFSLMHLDLDKFKWVNDTFGHAAGDEVLQTVATRLRAQVRGTDTIARMGGDEFVVIMRNTVRREQLSPAADRIIEGLEEPILFNGNNLEISCSIGITISIDYDVPEAAKLQHDADMALYQSKRDGRGRHTYFLTGEDKAT